MGRHTIKNHDIGKKQLHCEFPSDQHAIPCLNAIQATDRSITDYDTGLPTTPTNIRMPTSVPSCIRYVYASNPFLIYNFCQHPAFVPDCLARLQIITRYQTPSTLFTTDFRLPPPIILMSQYSEDFSLRETQFFRDLGLVYIHCPSYIFSQCLSSHMHK